MVAATGDLGEVPESQLAESFWPGGVQPQAAAPSVDPPGGDLEGARDVTIVSPTEGASIAYTTDEGEDPHWRLYTGPVYIDGDVVLRARAVRYGWAESPETTADFQKSPLAGRG